MLKNKDFWVGLVIGFILYYLYSNHFKGMKGGGA